MLKLLSQIMSEHAAKQQAEAEMTIAMMRAGITPPPKSHNLNDGLRIIAAMAFSHIIDLAMLIAIGMMYILLW